MSVSETPNLLHFVLSFGSVEFSSFYCFIYFIFYIIYTPPRVNYIVHMGGIEIKQTNTYQVKKY